MLKHRGNGEHRGYSCLKSDSANSTKTFYHTFLAECFASSSTYRNFLGGTQRSSCPHTTISLAKHSVRKAKIVAEFHSLSSPPSLTQYRNNKLFFTNLLTVFSRLDVARYRSNATCFGSRIEKCCYRFTVSV